jgi:hypothetical protein
MTEQEAVRVAERAEGLYMRAVRHARDKSRGNELRMKAQSDARLLGIILGRDAEEDLFKEDARK